MTMTKDAVIQLANEAELCQCIWIDTNDEVIESLVWFAKLVAAKAKEQEYADLIRIIEGNILEEREACAVIAEELFCGCGRGECPEGDLRAQDIAGAIRARGQAE